MYSPHALVILNELFYLFTIPRVWFDAIESDAAVPVLLCHQLRLSTNVPVSGICA
jgi:hypothetical protein